MKLRQILKQGRQRFHRLGLGSVEAIIALALAGIAVAATVSGFVHTLRSTSAATYSEAAQLLAVEGLERVRAAKWDAITYPVVDEVVNSNFPVRVHLMDAEGGNIWATNYTSIRTVSTNPWIKSVEIRCVYSTLHGGPFTNRLVSYISTENGQQNLTPASPPPPGSPPPPPEGTDPDDDDNDRGDSDDDWGDDDDDDDDDD